MVTARRLLWPVLAVVFVGALVFGSIDGRDARTTTERVDDLAGEVRCPTCSGLSVAESQTPLAQSLYQEISDRVTQGQSDDEIRSYVVSRYGEGALLAPKNEGIAMVVWMLPIAGAGVAVVVVVLVVRNWRRRSSDVVISDDDRALVASALQQSESEPAPGSRR